MKIPAGACDCHVHAGASIGESIERVVIIHPALDALKKLGKRARGVAAFDQDTSLEGMHDAGVRGVLVDLESTGVQDTVMAHRLLHEAAARVAPLGWHVETFARISGPHRVPFDPGPLVRALVAANPERCVWGSDWPHPDAGALERLHGWVGNEALFRKILVENPARLYDFPP